MRYNGVGDKGEQWWDRQGDKFVRVTVEEAEEEGLVVEVANPVEPEYEVWNKDEELEVEVGQLKEQSKRGKKAEDMVEGGRFSKIMPRSSIPFVWPNRLNTPRSFGVKIGNTL